MYRKSIVCVFLVFVSGWCTLVSAESSSTDRNNENANCSDIGDCPMINFNCKEKCGCDKNIPTTLNKTTGECVVNITSLLLSLKGKYNTEDNDISTEDDVNDMATKIRDEADRLFQGVIIAAFLFVTCASVCTLTACIYCFWINYTDNRLKRSISVFAKKVGKISQVKKSSAKVPTAPMAESCNVVVGDAGVFCV